MTLTQYSRELSDVDGVPIYTENENIWSLPVPEPTVSITGLPESESISASSSASVSIAQAGAVQVSSAKVNVFGAGGATTSQISGNEDSVSLDASGISVDVRGQGNSLVVAGKNIELSSDSELAVCGAITTVTNLNESGDELSPLSSTEYNGSGQETLQKIFNPDGTVQSLSNWLYGADGSLDGSTHTVNSVDAAGDAQSTTVVQDGSGLLTGITLSTIGSIGTTTDQYSTAGLLTSSASVGPGGTTVTTYANANDLNLATITTLDTHGNVQTVSTTTSNGDGTYTTTVTDANGNVVSKDTTPGSNSNQTLRTEYGIEAALNLVSDLQNGQWLAAGDSALKLASALAQNKTLGEASLGLDGFTSAINFVKSLDNGNIAGAIESGTVAVSDAVKLIEDGAPTPALDAAGSLIAVGADIAQGNYAQAAIDAVCYAAPEIGVPLEIVYLLYSIFSSKSNEYDVSDLTKTETISLGDDSRDIVQFAYDVRSGGDDSRDITINLGSGANVVNAGEGEITFNADANVGQDIITIPNSDGYNRWDDKHLVFGGGVTAAQVQMERLGNDMIFHVGAHGQSITFKDWFSSTGVAVGDVTFADGTVWKLQEDSGQPLYQFGNQAHPSLTAAAGYDNIFDLGQGNETVTVGDSAKSVIIGGAGSSDIKVGESFNTTILSATGNDDIDFAGTSGTASIDLGIGNNTVSTEDQRVNPMVDGTNFSIKLGKGNNTVVQNWAKFDYEYDVGGGNDTIETPNGDFFDYDEKAQNKTMHFGAGITQADLSLSRTASDLIINTGNGNGTITIQDWFLYAGARIGKFEFADGSSFTSDDLKNALIRYRGDGDLEGWEGDDEIIAGNGNDTLSTNGGNDTLIGGSGNDMFNVTMDSTATISTGDGNDTVSINLGTADVTLGAGADSVLVDCGNGESKAAIVRAGAGQDTVTLGQQHGAPVAEVFAGTGELTLLGNGDFSTLHYDLGDGNVVVDITAGSLAKLSLGTGISRSNLYAVRNGNDLELMVGSASTSGITFTGWFAGGYQPKQIVFADGTVASVQQINDAMTASGGRIALWNEVIGTSGDDALYYCSGSQIFDGKGGSDTESSYGNNDTFIFNAGYGSLEINSFPIGTNQNVLRLGSGISASASSVTGDDYGAIYLTDGIAGDRIKLDSMLSSSGTVSPGYGVREVDFADGTVWSAEQLVQMAHQIEGTTGGDALTGTLGGADVFDGKGGNDTETGGGNGDTFAFNQGYGSLDIKETAYTPNGVNVLELGSGITSASLAVTADSSGNLYIADGISGDKIEIDSMLTNSYDGVQEVQFADGTTWSRAQLIEAETTGTSGNDVLYGSSGADVFDGKGGIDTAIGGGGNDTFIFNPGDGALDVVEVDRVASDVNVLRLGAGISPASTSVTVDSAGNLYVSDGLSGDRIKLDSMMTYSGMLNTTEGVQQVQFTDGTVWTAQQLVQMAHHVNGTLAADKLVGTSGGSDVFDGKGGADIETGNGHNDTFIFDEGYGNLEINEWDYYTSDVNVLSLGAGINASSFTVKGDSAGNLYIGEGISGDRIQLDGLLSSKYDGVQQVQFADGTVWSRAQLIGAAATGTATADTLYGSSVSDVFDGKGGNDIEYGSGGADTYVLQPGYGPLTVVNGSFASSSAAGTLAIEGVDPNQLWLERVGNDLRVDVMGSSTSATVQNWFSSARNQLSELTVSGGSGGASTLDTQIDQLVQAMATFTNNNAGFDPTSSANPIVTDPTLLAAVNHAWHA